MHTKPAEIVAFDDADRHLLHESQLDGSRTHEQGHDERLSRLPGVEHLDTSIALRTVVRKTALPVDAFGTRPAAQRPPAP